ncbi:putative glycosyl transferase [Pseudoalteromonas sp. P1-9]|uniref:glycosyltransferase family 2 protein n=1 Tax=Pseudoalteromonas sp. P1-9 TaxID=1710354 RepID=UPI0006D627E5|nr:glycosyltransferase [Pseudoalteromonas sp. P1-9]KPV96569.1 putative glycosyl transferase [Pseudoalteromonas sp. P1-9]
MITIAIPCYKPDFNYLEQAINSVLTQSLDCYELLIVDGEEVPNLELQKLAKKYQHVPARYIYNTADKTMAGNWNFAIQSSQTELVTLLHSDDFLETNYILRMTQIVGLHPGVAAYFCGASIVDESSRTIISFPDLVKYFIRPRTKFITLQGEKGIISLLKGCYIFCPTICYRKSKLGNCVFNKKWKMVTDLQFYIDLLIANKQVLGVHDKLYTYRRHKENQTSKLTVNCERFNEEVIIYDQIANLFSNSSKVKLVASKKRIIKLHLFFLIVKNILFFRFQLAYRYFKFLKTSV